MVQPTTSAPPRVLNAEAELGMTPGLSNPPVTTTANDLPVIITTMTLAMEVHQDYPPQRSQFTKEERVS